MPIDLSSPEQIPATLRDSLSQFLGEFQETDSLDALIEIAEIASLQKELNSYVEDQYVLGFHFTRADPSQINAEGLVVQSGSDARMKFLRDHKERLNSEHREKIVRGWKSYFTSKVNNSRDGKIWFNLTRSPLTMSAAKPLLEFYGGEIVHMPFRKCTDLARIFREIGEPLVICCELRTNELTTFRTLPWGRVWLSAFHVSVNDSASQEDLDVYMSCSLPPGRIIDIRSPIPNNSNYSFKPDEG